jgi:hypothetical protein
MPAKRKVKGPRDGWGSLVDVLRDWAADHGGELGSTSAPKGVMVSHRNLLHSLGAIARFFRAGLHRDLGLPAAIYRMGWVVGHSRTGAWNRSDFIPRLIRACVDLCMACYLGSMTMTPVDFLARSLVHLSLRQSSLDRIFHRSNGERYSSEQLFEWVQGFGYPVERVPYERWEAAMKSSTQEISLAPMLLFLGEAAGSQVRLSDWFSSEPRIDAERTLGELAAAGIAAPRLSAERMRIYLDHFITSGYLPPPEA